MQWSTRLHESYSMYNWVETPHVLSLMLSLGLLFLIDMRMLGRALPNVPAATARPAAMIARSKAYSAAAAPSSSPQKRVRN